MNPILDQRAAFILAITLELQSKFLHNPRRRRIRWPRNRNHAVQFHSLENVVERRSRRFGRQAKPPAAACQPPSDLQIRIIAEVAHAAKSDHVSAWLFQQPPTAEAS